MTQQDQPQWPALVTCVGIVLMGVFVLTATSDPWFGWVFVAFGGVGIVWMLARIAGDALRRDRR